MKRRNFLHAAATGAAGLLATPSARAQEQPGGFSNSIVAIGWGVYSEPKFRTGGPTVSKVPGTMVSLTVARPQNVAPYFVTIFAQYRRNNDPWRDSPCHPDHQDVYSYDSRLRDIQELSDDFKVVTLFIPDAAHYLKPDLRVDIRMAIRFYRTDNRQLDGLEQPLPHETITPRVSGRRRTVEFYRPAGTPPFDMYDVAKGRKLQIG